MFFLSIGIEHDIKRFTTLTHPTQPTELEHNALHKCFFVEEFPFKNIGISSDPPGPHN